MGISESKVAATINYESILPGTEDLEKGLGGIYRRPGYESELIETYDESVRTLLDNFMYGYKRYPEGGCLGKRPFVEGKPQDYETLDMINSYAKALYKNNLLSITDGTEKRTDNTPVIQVIGHFTKNCTETVVSQFATWTINGTVVPLYETLGVETGDISDELKAKANELSINLFTFDSLVNEGKSLSELTIPKAGAMDVCMICYTSGTTAAPKGAIVSHKNMLSISTCVISYLETIGGFSNDDYHLSYLPMAHVFEHFVQTAVFHYGARIGFSQGETVKLLSDIQALRPTLFPSVPRMFTRIVDSVRNKVNKSGYIVSTMFNHAYDTKLQNLHSMNTFTHPIWDSIVFSKIQKQIGFDRIRLMVTGSAPLSSEYMDALRIIFSCSVIQGLGLTETGGGVCSSFFQDNATAGHCGGIIQSAECRLISVPEMGYSITDRYNDREVDSDGNVIKEGISCKGRGEICFRGNNIIKGYYKRPEINADVFDKDKWFHSGDIGMWLPNGAIQIIDRKKDLFKLAQGEYISPDKVTAVYLLDYLVGNIYIYGDSYQSYLVAIVVPDEDHLRSELRKKEMEECDMPLKDICLRESVKDIVMKSMNETAKNSPLMGFEKVKKIYLEGEEWTVENNLLTPTLKLKRDTSKLKYMKIIQDMYKE